MTTSDIDVTDSYLYLLGYRAALDKVESQRKRTQVMAVEARCLNDCSRATFAAAEARNARSCRTYIAALILFAASSIMFFATYVSMRAS